MVTRIILIITAFLLPTTAFAQTPEQTYWDWTTLPFSKEELAGRRDNLIKTLMADGKTGLVIIPSRDGYSHGETFRQLDDFYYFTGLELPNSILMMDVENNKSMVFVPTSDFRFHSATRPNDFPGRPLLNDSEITKRSGIMLKNIAHFPTLMEKSAKNKKTILLNNGRRGPISFAANDYIATHSPNQILATALKTKHKGLKISNVYRQIAQVRMIKSPAEIALLQKAADITVASIKVAAKSIKAGVTERYLEGVLEGNYKKLGSTRMAFASIIKTGANSLWPWRILATHYNRNNLELKDGDLVIFDVGTEYEQYVSDIGRTFPVSGKYTARQREILTMETGIADQIIAFIKPGITFRDVKELQDRIIPAEAKPYMQVGLFFGHHLGLSTGDPNLMDAELKPGMIFTVEPWYYNHDENISVFTEDMILVTETGAEVLSKNLPRTPDELEALMKN
jgi:Xaa-Pro aminopeptidase